jgi:hypothetical protein
MFRNTQLHGEMRIDKFDSRSITQKKSAQIQCTYVHIYACWITALLFRPTGSIDDSNLIRIGEDVFENTDISYLAR